MDRKRLRQAGFALVAVGVIGFLWAGWQIPEMGPQMLMPSSLIERFEAEAARYHTIQLVCVLGVFGGLALIFLPLGENKSFDRTAEDVTKQVTQLGKGAASKIQDLSRQAFLVIANEKQASNSTSSTTSKPASDFSSLSNSSQPQPPVNLPATPASPAPSRSDDFEPLGLSPKIDLASNQSLPVPVKPETVVAPAPWKKVSDDDLDE